MIKENKSPNIKQKNKYNSKINFNEIKSKSIINNTNINKIALVKYIHNNYIYYYYNRKLYDENESNKQKQKLVENIEKIAEFIFNQFLRWLNFVGPLFINSFICFFLLVFHSFINNIIPYWINYFNNKYHNKIYYYIFYIIICPLYLLIYIQLVLNYLLVVIIKPGSVSDLKKSKKFKEKLNPYYCYKYLPNLYYILRKGNLIYHKNYSFPICKTCQEIKPLRTHHCSVCNECHLRMDHHCPWVNNCIGLNNFRYFVLFIFYLWCICIFNTILSIYPFFKLKRFDENNEFSFATVLCLCGIAISTFFNLWYWSLILYNSTSIEYWSNRLKSNSRLINSYSMKTIKENLYVTFGSKNIFRILFIPNLKSLNISGLEWSKIANPSFEINGIKNNLELI